MLRKKDLQKKSATKLNLIKKLYEDCEYDEVVSNSGYVTEFALKAAVCKSISQDLYPESISIYRTHDIEDLIDLAYLRTKLQSEKMNSPEFFTAWSLLSKWSVNFRYKPVGAFDKEKALAYINALESEKGGVYPRIKKNW